MKRTLLLLACFLMVFISNCQDWKNLYPGTRISSISLVDSILWVNTESQLAEYNRFSEETRYFREFDAVPKPSYPDLDHFSFAVGDKLNPIVSISYTGLFELHGDHWVRYDESNTNLKPGRILNLQYDRKDTLWFEDGEYHLYRRSDSLTFDAIQLEEPSTVDFTFDRYNNLILNYYNKLVYIQNDSNIEFNVENSPIQEFSELEIQFDSLNKMWVMEHILGDEQNPDDSVNLFVFDGNEWSKITWLPATYNFLYPIPSIFEIDRDGNKWFVSDGDIQIYTDTGWVNHHLTEEFFSTSDLGIVDLETFFLSSTAYGLLNFEGGIKGINPVADNRLPGERISDIAIDSKSNVWIASEQTQYGRPALSLVRDDIWKVNNKINYEIQEGPVGVSKFFQDDMDNVYAFTQNTLSHIFDGENWEVPFFALPNGLHDIDVDINGNLWGVNSLHIYKYDNYYSEAIYETTFPYYDKKMAIDEAGNIWTIDNKYLSYYSEDSIVNYACNRSDPNCINSGYWDLEIDHDGNVWISSGGLTKFDGNRWTQYRFAGKNGITSDLTYTIAIDSNNTKYFGSFRGGLIIYDNVNWYYINGSNSELPHNTVNAVAFDNQDNVWLGTDLGISIFSKEFKGDTLDIEEATVEFFVDHTGIPDNQLFDIRVYPQPAAEILKVKLKYCSEGRLELRLYDMNGRVLTSKQYNNYSSGEICSLNCNNITSGIYILEVVSGNISRNRKVIISR